MRTQWVILGYALLILGAATGLNLYLERGRTESREQDRLMTQARVVQENIGIQLITVNSTLVELSKQAARGPIDSNLDNQLKMLTEAMPGVRTLMLIDTHGRTTASSRPELLGRNFSDRPYFQNPKQHPDADLLYVGTPFRTTLGVFTVNVARIISGPHGEFAGIISATLDPQYFAPLLNSVLYAPDMWGAIAHDNGAIFIMEPKKEGIEGKNVAQPGTFFSQHRASKKIATVHRGVAYITGEDRLLVWRTVNPEQIRLDRPLAVTVSRDRQTVFIGWEKDMMIQGGMFALLSLLAIAGLAIYQRRQGELEQQVDQATHELQITAERLYLATDAAGVGVWDYNLTNGRLDWDASMLAIYGIDPEDFQSAYESWKSCILPADLEKTEKALQQAILDDQLFTAHFRIRRGDGALRVIKALGRVHYDKQGRAIRVVGTNEDITEKQRQQDIRRELEDRLRATFDGAPIGMALVSLEGRFVEINQSLCQIVGYSKEQLQHLTFQEITYPEDLAGDLRLVEQLLQGELPFYLLEKRYIHQDGHLVWVLLNVSLVRDSDDQPLYFIAQIQDITARLRNEQALRDSERFLRQLTDVLPGMFGYWNQELRCTYANRSYLEWFGKGPEDILGASAMDLMDGQLYSDNEMHILAALRGEPQLFERPLLRSDGSTGYAWAHYIPDIDDGQVRGFFVMVTDITELKLMQHQLEQRTAEAEAASGAKSQFLANMSHEIRTPMNAILGLLHLLQRTELSARQADYAHKVEGAAKSLLSILNDILDFSKVEAGKLELEQIPFQVDDLLRNLAVILSASARQKHIEVLFDIDPQVPPTLLGDAMRLQQVLINLGGNAIKFTPTGEVSIILQCRTQDHTQATIDFIVRDTGIGIDPSQLNSLFDGFSQAEASTSRRFGGSGLGLAISQRLTRLMGGELTASSQLGQGSEFCFSLAFPLPPAAPLDNMRAALPALRILIVDDNDHARIVLGRMIVALGGQADSVASGREALARIDANNGDDHNAYDVILIDWGMPGMDGWEAAQHIRQSHHGAQTKLLLMVTADERENLPEHDAGDGALIDGYIAKPITPAQLRDTIGMAIAGAGSPAPANKPRQQRLLGLHLLVIEDNLINQQVAQELLALEGAEVEVASSAQEGIGKIRQSAPLFDAVLMDIQMPGMDGYSATRLLRQDESLRRLPIIAMTANVLTQDRAASQAAGMDGHIGKPIDLELLVATLCQHCGTPSPLPPAGMASSIADDIDSQEALARLGNNRALFARMARLFRQQQGDISLRLEQLLLRGDRSAAQRELHTLKGVAATLGARKLARHAAEMESQLRQNGSSAADTAMIDGLATEVALACTELESLAEQLQPDTSMPPHGQAAALDQQAVAAHLLRLEPLLATGNLKALDEYNQFKLLFAPALGIHLNALDEAMSKLDLPTALEKIRNLKEVIAHA